MMKKLSSFVCLPCVCLFCFLFSAAFVGASPKKELVGRIPIGPDNPRNSEGDFIRLESGEILYIYTRYYGDSSDDHAPSYLALRRSADSGATWSEEEEVVLPKEGNLNTMSVSLRRLPDRRLAIFYLNTESALDCRPYMRASSDEGKTWGDRIELVPDPSYNVVNNDRVEILSDGRILVPVARHRLNADGTNIAFEETADLLCLISDDGGTTWREGGRVPGCDGVIFQEPGLCTLADGRLLIYIRTNAGSQFFAYSQDAGLSWSKPVPSVLDSPLSPALVKRIPGSDDLLAIWNPRRTGQASGPGSRALVDYGRLSPDGLRLLCRRSIVGEVTSESQNWQYPAILFLDEDTFLTAFFSWSSGVDLYRIAVPHPEEHPNDRNLDR